MSLYFITFFLDYFRKIKITIIFEDIFLRIYYFYMHEHKINIYIYLSLEAPPWVDPPPPPADLTPSRRHNPQVSSRVVAANKARLRSSNTPTGP
jgi:hypothetical protein